MFRIAGYFFKTYTFFFFQMNVFFSKYTIVSLKPYNSSLRIIILTQHTQGSVPLSEKKIRTENQTTLDRLAPKI